MHRSILFFRVTIAASSVLFRLYEWPFDSSNVFRGENEIPSITVNPEHRSLNDFISPSKTLGADKKGFSSINFRFAFVCRSRASGNSNGSSRAVLWWGFEYPDIRGVEYLNGDVNGYLRYGCFDAIERKGSRNGQRSTYLSDLQL